MSEEPVPQVPEGRSEATGESVPEGRSEATGESVPEGRSEATGESVPDPWRSFRGVVAGTLILEAIVVLLALPVVAVGDDGLTPFSGGYLIGLAVVMVLLAGLQGRSWAMWANLGLQVFVIAGVVLHGAIGFIGVIFSGVWLLIWYLRSEVKRREERGLLPGQQQGVDE